MKELLKQMAVYNVWAHKKIMDAVLSIPVEKQKAEIPSSFSSLEKTILHMWDAESIWWQRMKLHERLMIPSENFKGTTVEAVNGLLSQSALWEAWVNNVSDNMLEHVFEFRNKKGDQIKMPIWQMLTHIFNHGTYHRGQLVNMLRQLGVKKIPQTDFSLWSRGRRV
ncbi:MAG: hypothetical protein IPH34_10720 [Chitinophagaceae bacterium]|nr:hypothetical protein [Chitinophagaceae bacterium]MBP7316395.1 hypothetical protein [Chitinophagaceae bacterium]HQV53985.1 DinB family protein [Chitinophagaceae bacterium]HQX95834.1 DinB family protein [Chitinophagaceae bacterium]HQZ50657.1 DinB family protein [Chitinophagaceae bacterium]